MDRQEQQDARDAEQPDDQSVEKTQFKRDPKSAAEKVDQPQKHETEYGIYSICKAGHIILHVNYEKGFVAIDGFSCNEEADPEKMVRELCSFLAPDKMKLTYVDRGDFGKKADMKPRHRNKSRKITQMRNMTKRFGKLLMKPKSL